MVSKFVRWLFERQQRKATTPWAVFEVMDFETDGRVKINFNYNEAFINHIKKMGFEAETDEDTVQLFFYTSSMRPDALRGSDETVQPDAHPQLSMPQNTLRL